MGFKCPVHGEILKPGRLGGRPWLRRGVFAAVVVLLVVAFVQKPAPRGSAGPPASRCLSRPAADVGIGPQPPSGQGSGRWAGMRPSPVCGRTDEAMAWTGTELIVWGGESCAGAECPSPTAPRLADGAAYRPATDSWRTLTPSPLAPRSAAATAWTGREMLVWGGDTGPGLRGPDAVAGLRGPDAVAGGFTDGAAYDPTSNRWRSLSPSPLAARSHAVAAWAGHQFVVWGGGPSDGATYFTDGDTWRTIAKAPIGGRVGAASVWTGRELLVWGGRTTAGELPTDGAAYDPVADTWRPLSASPLAGRVDAATAWTASELLVWGGLGPTGQGGDGAAYDPMTDRWRLLPPAPIGGRASAAAAWTGRELLVWGGVSGDDFFAEGAAFDPVAGQWRRMEPSGLTARAGPAAAWTGQELIVWGGLDASLDTLASAADGGRYRS